jgi:uncharacterized protein
MTDISEILKSQKFLEINSEIRNGVKKCKETCDFFSICGGGDPSNKLAEHGSFDVTERLTCKLRIKESGNILLDYLESEYIKNMKR